MQPYQADLLAIRFIFRNYLLDASGIGFGKNMHGFFQIERHHMRAALGDFVQPLLARWLCRKNRRRYQPSQPAKHDQAIVYFLLLYSTMTIAGHIKKISNKTMDKCPLAN